MKCKVCEREAENTYCELHNRAYRNILREYDVWKRASSVSWKEYLSEIVKNQYTGVWAKDVAEHLVKDEEK
jgi:hypothetical protein